jgi:pimeloyl-ACP methyl ester carboxylesterase
MAHRRAPRAARSLGHAAPAVNVEVAIREEVRFGRDGELCAGWFYPAEGPLPRPVVVMGHGLGATREMGLDAYARRFCGAGFSVLAFDYRHYGASEGQPRELLSIARQLADWRAAIAFVKAREGVDASRVAIWGSSFGGGHVLRLVASQVDVAAAIAQVPFSSGLASTLCLRLWTALRVSWWAAVDMLRGALGLSPAYIALVGRPGDVALMSASDSHDGYLALVRGDLESAGLWRNRVAARIGLALPFYSPARGLARGLAPLLMLVAERDTIAPARPAIDAAARYPRAELRRYPDGHFDYYRGEGFERAVADELAFLGRHLRP